MASEFEVASGELMMERSMPSARCDERVGCPCGELACGARLPRLGPISTAVVLLLVGAAWPAAAQAYQQEATAPHWIWHAASRGGDSNSFPAEACYFRKSFRIKENSRLVLDVTADNAFSLYLDGKLAAEGNDWGNAQHVEAKIGVGPHVLAVRASNEAPGPAGLLARGGILPLGQGIPIQTNSTWRTAGRFPRAMAGLTLNSTTPAGPGPWTSECWAAGPGAAWLSAAMTPRAAFAFRRALPSRLSLSRP